MGTHLGTAFAIDTGGYDTTGIAGTLTTRKETLNAYMHQGFCVSEDAYRAGGGSAKKVPPYPTERVQYNFCVY